MTSSGDRQTTQLFVSAQQFAQAGRLADARTTYLRCIERDPDFLPAVFAVGQLLVIQGEPGAANRMLSRAIDLANGNAAALRVVAPALAGLLANLVPENYHPKLDQDLRACLEEEQVDAQSLAGVIAGVLLQKYPDAQGDFDRIGSDPLWIAFLTRCINTHPRMEMRLTGLRRDLLVQYADAKAIPHAHLRSVHALALQAFASEYVWPVSVAEAARLDDPLDPVLGALYRPLIDLGTASSLRKLKRDRLSGLLVKRTLDDLAKERALAAGMPSLDGQTENSISAKVRRQYEEHPYPRWRAPPVPRPVDLHSFIEALPRVDQAAMPPSPLNVLIAGCGTGYEAIGVARTDPTLTITALDLSRASLAYGARMAEEMNISNIHFVQGDILDTGMFSNRFDVVYSTGVLHHMERPEDGLASIYGVLKPGGVMRIGLYSERARTPICEARNLIRERGWDATADGIRLLRDHILSLPPSSTLASLGHSKDFYSLSGCRDLAFHVQEHQYTLPAISALLQAIGLRLIGFDAPSDVMNAFARTYGPAADTLDLGLWDALEAQDPTLFIGMYLLWCQKPALP